MKQQERKDNARPGKSVWLLKWIMILALVAAIILLLLPGGDAV